MRGNQRVAGRGVAEPVGGFEARFGIGRAGLVAGMNAGDGCASADRGAERGKAIEADTVIDAISWHGEAATEGDDGHADAARIDIDHGPLPFSEDIADDRRGGEVAVHIGDEIGGTAQGADHAAKAFGGAAAIEDIGDEGQGQHVVASVAVGGRAVADRQGAVAGADDYRDLCALLMVALMIV